MITIAQISPFDVCNAKCWYCPVRYYPQSKTQHMPPDLFEKIIADICANKGGLVSLSFDFIYTAHYNEILLYRYFPEMLATLRKYEIKTMILSNGIAFTEDKINLVDKYRDVVIGINFNIPSFESGTWNVEVGYDKVDGCHEPKYFEKTMDNVRNVYSIFGPMVSIGVNSMDPAECGKRVMQGKELFPGLNIYPCVGLCDRAGLLHDQGIISNRAEIDRNRAGKTYITGCLNSGRLQDWLHINAYGEVFACCDDYYFDYVFGDLNTETLQEIMTADQRKEDLGDIVKDLCSKCSFAKWE